MINQIYISFEDICAQYGITGFCFVNDNTVVEYLEGLKEDVQKMISMRTELRHLRPHTENELLNIDIRTRLNPNWELRYESKRSLETIIANMLANWRTGNQSNNTNNVS